ncbi:phosphoribosylanthranilate isomerase [Sutcliffiella horikoshii]|uniref:phosphoribosylanthranilate isomerase n=1 Tax=Sutcliffiella horikoshii TaxID=79883 RepID=UPI001CFE80BF|nr:phosphoribosylanthranilate isomerase [Sutcliffiella horikoshii]
MSRTKVKFCGNKSLEDYEATVSSDADYLGFVFARSKRQVKPEQVAEWVVAVPPRNKRLVGIFVNQSKEFILHAVRTVPLDVVQCHGDEGLTFIKELKSQCNVDIWKVIHHEDETTLNKLTPFIGTIDGFVVDKKVGNQYGGTGTSFNWEHIPLYDKLSKQYGIPYMIAGGINVETLQELLPYSPQGIDLSSGIEENFAKSKEKMNLIERMVREHDKRTNTR